MAFSRRRLSHACAGPLFLKQSDLATMVVECMHKGVALGQYQLGAYVVMANHVHVPLLPRIAPSRLLQSLKGFTARQANRMMGRTGEPFWQAESYDHWVRDAEEYERIANYIENNPVKASLAARAEDYPWSSTSVRKGLDTIVETADTSVRATKGSTTEQPSKVCARSLG